MYSVCNIYELPTGKRTKKIKVDFDKVWSLQVRWNIDGDEAVVQYMYDKYRKLFPKLGNEIFEQIYRDYFPFERSMYDMSIYDWI